MPSATALRLVSPRFSSTPEWVETFGPEVADICALAGYAPDPEQELILDALFAIRADLRSAAFATTVVAARQTIKTGVGKMATLGWLFVTEQRLVAWTAHEMKTTRQAHQDLAVLIEDCPYLSRYLKPVPSRGIKYGNSDLSIMLADDRGIIFGPRTTGGMRGLTGDKVILDEGYALKAQHMGALLPTLNAVPDPQLLILSSGGMASSAVLRGYRDRGRGRLSARQAYFEWCADEEPCEDPHCTHIYGQVTGCAMDREHLWMQAIPTYGRRTDAEKITDFRDGMPPEEFAREFLVWWDDPTAGGPFPTGMWAARAESDLDPETGLALAAMPAVGALAVDVSWDRRSCAIGVAARREDGKDQVEVVEAVRDEGAPDEAPPVPVTMGNLVERTAIVARREGLSRVRLAKGSPAASLTAELAKAGLSVDEVGASDVDAACGNFFDAVVNDTLVHIGQECLDLAVGGAIQSGGASWHWDRKKGAVICPLYAVTLALDGLEEGSAGVFFFDELDDEPDDDSEEEGSE